MNGLHLDRQGFDAAARLGAAAFAGAASRSLAPVFRASRVVLADRRTQAPTEARVHFVNWPDWCLPYYCRYAVRRDPIRAWLDSGAPRAEARVARLSDLMPGMRTTPTAYPDERLGACVAGHVLTIALREDARVVAALSLVRAAGEGDFSDAECELAHAMTPVLELAWRGAHAGLASQAAPLESLTQRERQVALLVIAGHSNKSIARLLDASPWTVKNHLRAVFRKTGVSNRTALCALAHASGREER